MKSSGLRTGAAGAALPQRRAAGKEGGRRLPRPLNTPASPARPRVAPAAVGGGGGRCGLLVELAHVTPRWGGGAVGRACGACGG